jgi:chromatin segregation and condensation protein Rec8/ScpA/Scc1 (kleisin family)
VTLAVFDAAAMKDDIVTRLLQNESDLETSKYLDRLVELASLEEAEHQFLIDPFDRSVALVFQLFRSKDLDPWDVDLTSFLEMFEEKIRNEENIDLPTCGRLIRMAWQILRGQASTLIERQEMAWEDESEDFFDFDTAGWESDFTDDDYNFSVGVLTGAADGVLPSMFEGRIHREESRPVTLGELLMGLQSAKKISEEQILREQIAKERREANELARARFSGSLHVEDLEDDIRRTWEALREKHAVGNAEVDLKSISEHLRDRSMEGGVELDEAQAEAQVTALVSALFLTNRGYADLTQESGRNGAIILRDLHPENNDFDSLTKILNPKPEMEVAKDV